MHCSLWADMRSRQGQQPVYRRCRGIIEGFASAVDVAGPPDRFTDRCEEVQPQAHRLPQPYQQLVVMNIVVAAMETVTADHMVVLGLHVSLILFPLGTRTGEVDICFPTPGDKLMVEEFTTTITLQVIDVEWDSFYCSFHGRQDLYAGVVCMTSR